MKRVLVTGANGFIGLSLCSALKDRGCFVRAITRTVTDGPWDEVVHIDLASDAIPSLLCEGIDTIFHLAGKAHALAETCQDKDEYFIINTKATKSLLDEAKRGKVERFIYFSSVKAVGDSSGVMDESVLLLADTPYGQSKHASEKLVLEGGYVSHAVVIRPSMVYGNTEKGNLPKMIRAIAAGRFPPLPETNNVRSMVHVDDVVRASLLAAEKPDAAGKVYIVTDGQAYSTRKIYEWICEALGKSLPVWSVPMFLLKVLGKVGDVIGSMRGRRFVFDSDALEKLTGSAAYSSGKIERELGFSAEHHLQESLPSIVTYLERTR